LPQSGGRKKREEKTMREDDDNRCADEEQAMREAIDPEDDAVAFVVEGAGKPIVRLTGEDGNVFNVIGRVSRALKDAGLSGQAAEFRTRALAASSYDEVLTMCFEYCDVH
jgi:hypothetical protein